METYKTFDDLPADRRHELKAFKTLTTLTCLECGYSGLMGETTVVPRYLSAWLWLPVVYVICVLFSGSALMSLIIGVVVGVLLVLFHKKFAHCPSCKATLTAR